MLTFSVEIKARTYSWGCFSVDISQLIHSPKSFGGWKLKFVKTNGIFGPCRHCLDGGNVQASHWSLSAELPSDWSLGADGWGLGRCKAGEKYEAENVMHGPLTRLSTTHTSHWGKQGKLMEMKII